MSLGKYQSEIRSRLQDEVGTIYKDAPEKVALLYPSPYHVGMSSLGFQTLYREINSVAGRVRRARIPARRRRGARAQPSCRSVQLRVAAPVGGLPGDRPLGRVRARAGGRGPRARAGRHPAARRGPQRAASVHPVRRPAHVLQSAAARAVRGRHPDGRGRQTIHEALDVLFATRGRKERSRRWRAFLPASCPSCTAISCPRAPSAATSCLPAYAVIRTPQHRAAQHVPDRSRARLFAWLRLLRDAPLDQRRHAHRAHGEDPLADSRPTPPRSAWSGAAVSDHPKICDIIETLADRGVETSLSSLRPDRLNDRFVAALRRRGTRPSPPPATAPASACATPSTARRARSTCTRWPGSRREHGMKRLKLYMMVGLPEEIDADIDELIQFGTEISKVIPLSLGIAPFVSKRNTPARRPAVRRHPDGGGSPRAAAQGPAGQGRRARDQRALGLGRVRAWRRAARPRAWRCTRPCRRAAASRTIAAPSRRFRRPQEAPPGHRLPVAEPMFGVVPLDGLSALTRPASGGRLACPE